MRIQKLFRSINKENPDFKTKCLVHCAMGMSRSATSVIMFIMRLFSMKLKDAFEFVKTQREKTDPNDGFMEQLRSFESKAFTFQNEELTDSGSNPGSDHHHHHGSHHPSCIVGGSGVRRVQSMSPMVTQSGVISGGIDGLETSPPKHVRLDSPEEGKREVRTVLPKLDKQGTEDSFFKNGMPTIAEESLKQYAPSENHEKESIVAEPVMQIQAPPKQSMASTVMQRVPSRTAEKPI